MLVTLIFHRPLLGEGSLCIDGYLQMDSYHTLFSPIPNPFRTLFGLLVMLQYITDFLPFTVPIHPKKVRKINEKNLF